MTTDRTEPAASNALRRLPRFLGRFARNREGSTAIEFTMLAIPFAMLVFAILESCISFAAQEVMANATDDIARQIRTGQLRGADTTKLEEMICSRLSVVVTQNCPNSLFVDLQNFQTFAEAAKIRIKFTSAGDLDTSGFVVEPGGTMSKNMLRVFYKWPVITDFMRSAISNLPDGKTLHFATTTWQNEPFDE
jgi:Flp pilus assembly protein TadG